MPRESTPGLSQSRRLGMRRIILPAAALFAVSVSMIICLTIYGTLQSYPSSSNVFELALLRATHRLPEQSRGIPEGSRLAAHLQTAMAKQDKYYLAAVIFNRIFDADKFHLTFSECIQWLEYMRYAGVQHVFWYDTAKTDLESQEAHLKLYVDSGFVTYHRWQLLFPGRQNAGYNEEQDRSYQHCLDHYRSRIRWLLECDVDEYPFSSQDTEPGFAVRLLRRKEDESPGVVQWLMQSMLFVGQGEGQEGLLIDRFRRRHPRTRGLSSQESKSKPLVLAAAVHRGYAHNPHRFEMREGSTEFLDDQELRANHYWGPRIHDFGPDPPGFEGRTVRDDGVAPMVAHLQRLLGPEGPEGQQGGRYKA